MWRNQPRSELFRVTKSMESCLKNRICKPKSWTFESWFANNCFEMRKVDPVRGKDNADDQRQKDTQPRFFRYVLDELACHDLRPCCPQSNSVSQLCGRAGVRHVSTSSVAWISKFVFEATWQCMHHCSYTSSRSDLCSGYKEIRCIWPSILGHLIWRITKGEYPLNCGIHPCWAGHVD